MPTLCICIDEFSGSTRQQIANAGSGLQKLLISLGSTSTRDWFAFGCFAARVKQLRRRMRHSFEIMSNRLAKSSYFTRKVEWKARGRYVCRHGVFFTKQIACPCLSAVRLDPRSWEGARLMPHLNHDLIGLVVIPFDLVALERAGVLQAKMWRLDW